jgi:hypothetical protein
VTGVVPVQTPAWQVSTVVHPLPSSHAEPSAFGAPQMPVAGSQAPAWWH